MPTVKYKRILLKLSGEALAGDQGYGIDPAVISGIAAEIKEVVALGVEVALVIGGGNIFRGVNKDVSTPKLLTWHRSAGMPFDTMVSFTQREGQRTMSARSTSRTACSKTFLGMGGVT